MTTLLFAASFLFVTQSIGDARDTTNIFAEWRYDPELIPDSLILKLQNRGSRAICIPRAEAEGSSLRLFQRNNEVDRVRNENRAIMYWRDADLADGLTVIPPGRSVTLIYDLRDWALAPGLTDGRLELPHVDCLAYFQGAKPWIVRKSVTYQFTARRGQPPPP